MDAREFHAAPDTDKRAIGRLLRFALIASVAFAVVLLVLLAGASANTSIFERHYPALLVTTAVMALALLVLVGFILSIYFGARASAAGGGPVSQLLRFALGLLRFLRFGAA